VTDIEIDSNQGRGLITFANIVDAFKAKLNLHGQRLTRDRAYLEVEFVQKDQAENLHSSLKKANSPREQPV
jgi:hypothetical protein